MEHHPNRSIKNLTFSDGTNPSWVPSMKGGYGFEEDRNAYCVYWHVPSKKKTIKIRHYYGIKLYSEEMAKNGRTHEAACHESFEPFLPDLLADNGSEFLFTSKRSKCAGKRYGDSVLNKLWANACKQFGIETSLYNGTKHSTLD